MECREGAGGTGVRGLWCQPPQGWGAAQAWQGRGAVGWGRLEWRPVESQGGPEGEAQPCQPHSRPHKCRGAHTQAPVPASAPIHAHTPGAHWAGDGGAGPLEVSLRVLPLLAPPAPTEALQPCPTPRSSLASCTHWPRGLSWGLGSPRDTRRPLQASSGSDLWPVLPLPCVADPGRGHFGSWTPWEGQRSHSELAWTSLPGSSDEPCRGIWGAG